MSVDQDKYFTTLTIHAKGLSAAISDISGHVDDPQRAARMCQAVLIGSQGLALAVAVGIKSGDFDSLEEVAAFMLSISREMELQRESLDETIKGLN